jgi:uncharacterized protein (DUF488 family)
MLMPMLYTIGIQGRSLESFVTALQDAKVDAVIDIRLRNTSQLAGYSKRDDLSYLLREGFAIAYEHRPELAPTPELLDAYHENKDWPAYEQRFGPLLEERAAALTGQALLARYRSPCLLCSEATPEHCHRRLVAEYWASHLAGITIVHL